MAQPHPSPISRKKAVRRVERLQAAYAKTDGRVQALRERLAHMEEKLTRRAARLAEAHAVVEQPAPVPDVNSPDVRTSKLNGARQAQVVDASVDQGAATMKRQSGSKSAVATKR